MMVKQKSNDNTFGHEINSNCKHVSNESIDFNSELIESNDNESIESNHDSESFNKSLKFLNESIHNNTRSAYNSAGIFDPVSRNKTHVENKIQSKESKHTQHPFINCYGSNCVGDIVGNGDDFPDLLCCTCNVDHDSSGDEVSDDVETIDYNNACSNITSSLFSSSDVDVDDGEDEFLHGKAFQAIDHDIDIIITDLNKFCLFSKFRISTRLICQDSIIVNDTITSINDDYVLNILDMELVSMQNLNEIAQTLRSVCKKMDEIENNEATYEFDNHTFINDVNNLFVSTQLKDENNVEIENGLVESNDVVPFQESSLPPTAQCGIAADGMPPTVGFHPSDQHKYKMVVKDGNGVDKLIHDYGEAHQQDPTHQADF